MKVPLLLVFTSGITIPSLYVLGALRGLRFRARGFAAHLMVAHTVLAAVLASLAPVLAFFALTTSSYSFMVLLVVVACAVAGLFGVGGFVRALHEPPPVDALAVRTDDAPESDEAPLVPAPPPPVPAVRAGAWRLLGWWLFLYVFVGTQAGWILRPFIED